MEPKPDLMHKVKQALREHKVGQLVQDLSKEASSHLHKTGLQLLHKLHAPHSKPMGPHKPQPVKSTTPTGQPQSSGAKPSGSFLQLQRRRVRVANRNRRYEAEDEDEFEEEEDLEDNEEADEDFVLLQGTPPSLKPTSTKPTKGKDKKGKGSKGGRDKHHKHHKLPKPGQSKTPLPHKDHGCAKGQKWDKTLNKCRARKHKSEKHKEHKTGLLPHKPHKEHKTGLLPHKPHHEEHKTGLLPPHPHESHPTAPLPLPDKSHKEHKTGLLHKIRETGARLLHNVAKTGTNLLNKAGLKTRTVTATHPSGLPTGVKGGSGSFLQLQRRRVRVVNRKRPGQEQEQEHDEEDEEEEEETA